MSKETLSAFERGRIDCANGFEPLETESTDYMEGYSYQYSIEQQQSQGGFN